MNWIYLAFGAAISWGFYGAMLHRGQVSLGNPMKALLCVGVAYFLLGVLWPVGSLATQGNLRGFNTLGTTTATAAGLLGALGAVCIIYAFRSGGSPAIVMPIVFGLAPLINVLVTMAIHPPSHAPNPLLYVGYLLASLGVGMVLYFRP
jgi:hypothetical protein